MRLTREIQTEFGPMLFSPVHARTLEPGDVVAGRRVAAMMGRPWVVSHVVPTPGEPGKVDIHFRRGPMLPSTMGVNDTVMRAVGARSGRML